MYTFLHILIYIIGIMLFITLYKRILYCRYINFVSLYLYLFYQYTRIYYTVKIYTHIYKYIIFPLHLFLPFL